MNKLSTYKIGTSKCTFNYKQLIEDMKKHNVLKDIETKYNDIKKLIKAKKTHTIKEQK